MLKSQDTGWLISHPGDGDHEGPKFLRREHRVIEFGVEFAAERFGVQVLRQMQVRVTGLGDGDQLVKSLAAG